MISVISAKAVFQEKRRRRQKLISDCWRIQLSRKGELTFENKHGGDLENCGRAENWNQTKLFREMIMHKSRHSSFILKHKQFVFWFSPKYSHNSISETMLHTIVNFPAERSHNYIWRQNWQHLSPSPSISDKIWENKYFGLNFTILTRSHNQNLCGKICQQSSPSMSI